MSGEHPLSRAILERVDQELGQLSKYVEIRNLAFQPPNMPQRFGVGSLESKILCAHHNNALSDYDQEALATFNAFEKLHYAAAGHPVVIQSLYTLDGDKFERFLLKAVCGGVCSGIFPSEEIWRWKGVEPPDYWLGTCPRIGPCFGLTLGFPLGFGLFGLSPDLGAHYPPQLTSRCSSAAKSSEDCGSGRSVATPLRPFPSRAAETRGCPAPP
jgi:hypothetical protein